MTNKSLFNNVLIRHFAFMGKAQFKDEELLRSIVIGLKKLREEKSITQETFYNDTGIHISRIETGKVNISLSTLSKTLFYFNISLSDFFKKIDL